MKHLLNGSIALLLGAASLYGQDVGSSLVFPQVADGVQGDSSYYTSLLWITNVGEPSTCTLSLYGLNASRVLPSRTITVPGGGWAIAYTEGREPLATGYGRLDCSQPVTASLTYSLFTPTGARVGMATVFPASAVSYAMHPLLLDGKLRYGIAIANDDDAPASFIINYNDSISESQSAIKGIQIPPRSQYAGFVDQILTLPAKSSGSLEIVAIGIGAGSFRVTLLLFDGAVFTTLIPVTVR